MKTRMEPWGWKQQGERHNAKHRNDNPDLDKGVAFREKATNKPDRRTTGEREEQETETNRIKQEGDTTMSHNITVTAHRVYYTTEDKGIWYAHYQPLNPKTKMPWQASRMIGTPDCYRLSNFNTGVSTGVVMGILPPFEEWCVRGGMLMVHVGLSSELLALVAIEAEKERSGK